MNIPTITITAELGGALLLLTFVSLVVWFWLRPPKTPVELRPIPGFNEGAKAVRQVVESGSEFHISLGSAGLFEQAGAAAVAGIDVVQMVAPGTWISDNQMVISSGNGETAILARDSLQQAYNTAEITEPAQELQVQIGGMTPFSYAAGILPLTKARPGSTHVLAGNFGLEAAFISDSIERNEGRLLAGSDSAYAQAIFSVMAEQAFLGEELYAGGAYLNSEPWRIASLRAQDIMRLVLGALILAGLIFRLIGLL